MEAQEVVQDRSEDPTDEARSAGGSAALDKSICTQKCKP